MVVILLPRGDGAAGPRERREQPIVEAFVPEATVEALDIANLHRIAGRDVVPFNSMIFRPGEDHLRVNSVP